MSKYQLGIEVIDKIHYNFKYISIGIYNVENNYIEFIYSIPNLYINNYRIRTQISDALVIDKSLIELVYQQLLTNIFYNIIESFRKEENK